MQQVWIPLRYCKACQHHSTVKALCCTMHSSSNPMPRSYPTTFHPINLVPGFHCACGDDSFETRAARAGSATGYRGSDCSEHPPTPCRRQPPQSSAESGPLGNHRELPHSPSSAAGDSNQLRRRSCGHAGDSTRAAASAPR